MMEPLLTKKEAAAYLKVSVRTVDRLIQEHGLRIYKVGRAIRIPESSIMQMLDREGLTMTELNGSVSQLYQD